jgi:penicillin V acylase-like amidase (Ntn superfamily)
MEVILSLAISARERCTQLLTDTHQSPEDCAVMTRTMEFHVSTAPNPRTQPIVNITNHFTINNNNGVGSADTHWQSNRAHCVGR